jgi:hypothetical protein
MVPLVCVHQMKGSVQYIPFEVFQRQVAESHEESEIEGLVNFVSH